MHVEFRIDLLKNNDKILDHYATHSVDVNLTNMSNVVRFMEFDTENKNNINSFILVNGRLPERSGEIALDEEAMKINKDLKIGQEFAMETGENTLKSFKKSKFKIVGIVRNPMYIERNSRGITPVGKGSVDYFAVLNSSDISMPVYTELYVRFKNVQGMDGYSKEYENLMDENTKYLEELYASQNNNGVKYHVFDRKDNPGYLGYKDAINSLDKIASVLPMLFFALAVMICLTTMTRMVEENRVEIGTLKALGYGNYKISKKYIVYASLASISGGILGIALGCNVIPIIISNAYSSLYTLPTLKIFYYPSFIIQSMAISILCTVGASLFVIIMELRNKPADLMKVKAPKLGKKILLERITPLWKRFSFNYKVTFRNIFRYKQRMIMTILGISGCMAILVTGFGIKDSNQGVVERQFENLWRYEAMVILDEKAPKEAKDAYINTVNKLSGYENNMNFHQEAVIFSKKAMNNQEATLYVPENPDKLQDFIILRHRKSNNKYSLTDDGVIITEKLAKLLGASEGQTVTMTTDNNVSYKIKIDKITENYLKHYIYMSPAYYESVFKKKPVYNTQLLNMDMDKADKEDDISSKLLNCKNVLNVALMSKIQKTTEDSTANMNLVIMVIIISAGCLAFAVLYNLNNINVSERIRELSTIKVLGFYHNEVTMYILRENIMLTLLGILAGSVLGKMLHSFIIYTSETDGLMMYPQVSTMSYLLSALLTVIFSIIVMVIMHIKLQKINMIDALKSSE
ncbi:putative ABC transport system permease protein [Hathewaya proteolytica DSM 3090]|uniref:Putative ABC transport system permease protein n=1 Tax=Hathewaya proteolytica DSM 3090 TaxID=1121331 RepID=A0A1M6MX87_9CLOT|nr:ABC transporter permease [Hathewaya proteolytica]SHJ88085.1 putative ABC transport system permease protein [Hathewaya proteolytica DSM 3090]